jgi:hypothetical protein
MGKYGAGDDYDDNNSKLHNEWIICLNFDRFTHNSKRWIILCSGKDYNKPTFLQRCRINNSRDL